MIFLMQITLKQKKFCKDFEIKNSGECHDLYVQGDTLMLADVFGSFRSIFLKV